MNFNRSAKKKMSFERFLSYEYAGDYINQTTPYAEQIEQAAQAIREADYVLLGAGAGMSTAAGAEYGGKFFEENFADRKSTRLNSSHTDSSRMPSSA